MIRLIAAVLFALAVIPVQNTHALPAKENLHIYLAIGQSNMVGRAIIQDTSELDSVLLFNDSQEWEPAKNPMNRYSPLRKTTYQGVSPTFKFSDSLQSLVPGVTIGMVVCAKGGTRIGQWQKGTALYDTAINRLNLALPTGTLKGVLWHQGESDSPGNLSTYMASLAQLVGDIRTDLGDSTLPFIAGQLGPWDADYRKFNRMIPVLPYRVPYTAVVSSDGLTNKDWAHFDTPSQYEFGYRYAEAMYPLVYGSGYAAPDDAVAPAIDSARALDGTTVEIFFSEFLDRTAAETAGNYTIAGLTVTAAALSYNNRDVTLTVTDMSDAAQYTVQADGIVDLAATPNTGNGLSAQFTYTAPAADIDTIAPSIASVTATDSNVVVIAFSEKVDAADAENAGNYTIAGLSVSAAALSTDSVTVILAVSAMTDSAEYTVEVGTVSDVSDPVNTATGLAAPFTYSAEYVPVDTIAPSIVSVRATDSVSVVIVFSEAVARGEVTDAMNFTIAGLSVASAALAADDMTLTLTVSAMTDSAGYTVVTGSINDTAAEPNMALSLEASFTYYAAPVPDIGDMAVYLQFDGSLDDASGNGHSATWKFDPSYAEGKFGQGIAPAAESTYVIVAQPGSVPLVGINTLTLCAWARKNDPAEAEAIIYKHAVFRLDVTAASGGGGVTGDSTGSVMAEGMGGTDDTLWHHYAITYDGVMVVAYLDGVRVDAPDQTGLLRNDPGRDIQIGIKPFGGTPFNGVIDEVRIYDRALNRDQIAEVYNLQPVSGMADEPVRTGSGNGMTVTPNPAGNVVRISVPVGYTGTVEIYGADGRVVFESVPLRYGGVQHVEPLRNVVWNGMDTNGHHVESGVYYVRCGTTVTRLMMMR